MQEITISFKIWWSYYVRECYHVESGPDGTVGTPAASSCDERRVLYSDNQSLYRHQLAKFTRSAGKAILRCKSKRVGVCTPSFCILDLVSREAAQ